MCNLTENSLARHIADMLPDFRRFSQNLVLWAVQQHAVLEEIIDFCFGEIESVKVGQTGNFFDFFIHELISWNVNIGAVSVVNDSEVTYKIN